MSNLARTNDFWAPHQLEPDEWRFWQAGTLRLWATRQQHEWRVMPTRVPEEREQLDFSQAEDPPETGAWRRWAFKEEDSTLTVQPAMPDKPVVIRPDSPIRIPRGNEVVLFVSIPIVLQFYIGPRRELFIYEEPTVILSRTWFGAPVAGELCYALRTGGSRDLTGVKKGEHRAICPVLIRNSSEEELNFDKLCVRAMHVNLYQGATRLWSEEIQVTYQGEKNFSEVTFSKDPPDYERIHSLIATAREPVPKGNFIKKSFDSLWTS